MNKRRIFLGRLSALACAAALSACLPANTPAAQTGDRTMIDGLTKHHSQSCGPVQINTYFSPRTPVTHLSPTGGTDATYAYRLAFELINTSGPDGLTVQYQVPAPLFYFFKIGRYDKNGAVIDLTQSQIGGMHLGEPIPRDVTFAAKGDAYYDQLSYRALASIAPANELIPARYQLSLKPFAIVTINGKECTATIPPMTLEAYAMP